MYKEYKDNPNVVFYFVYVREAHPKKEMDLSKPGFAGVARHKKIDTRVLAAQKCAAGLQMSMTYLIDGLDNKVEKAYKAWPACTAVVDVDGKIVFYSRGPSGVKPAGTRKALVEKLKLQPSKPATPTTQPAKKTAEAKGNNKAS